MDGHVCQHGTGAIDASVLAAERKVYRSDTCTSLWRRQGFNISQSRAALAEGRDGPEVRRVTRFCLCRSKREPVRRDLVMQRCEVSRQRWCCACVAQAAKQEDHVLALEADMDRTLLRLYQQALKADRWSPASSVANVFLY